jgi:hypothetical protein
MQRRHLAGCRAQQVISFTLQNLYYRAGGDWLAVIQESRRGIGGVPV